MIGRSPLCCFADFDISTFVNIKELKGSWKKDPRYEDSYYFVREEEKED